MQLIANPAKTEKHTAALKCDCGSSSFTAVVRLSMQSIFTRESILELTCTSCQSTISVEHSNIFTEPELQDDEDTQEQVSARENLYDPKVTWKHMGFDYMGEDPFKPGGPLDDWK